MLSSEGALLWSSDHDTWGSLRILRRATTKGDYWTEEVTETPAQTVSITFCPIRFQGQWEDAETGLNYNRFRYYDPAEASFSQADRIGVWGGFRAHGYVDQPTTFVDSRGLRGVRVTPGQPGGCADFVLEISRAVYPETAGHIADAISNGQPQHVTLNRPGAGGNRAELRPDMRRARSNCCRTGTDIDEWPMAMFDEGGLGASLREILAGDNRGAGSSINHALRGAGVQNGQTVCFRVVDAFIR